MRAFSQYVQFVLRPTVKMRPFSLSHYCWMSPTTACRNIIMLGRRFSTNVCRVCIASRRYLSKTCVGCRSPLVEIFWIHKSSGWSQLGWLRTWWRVLRFTNSFHFVSIRLRDHPNLMQGWESVCWLVIGITLPENWPKMGQKWGK